jgi:CRP/FNR family transcriptional regulator, cyclic AMP receptor protein
MSEFAVVDFLATVPLFDGWQPPELADLARLLRRRTLRVGEMLWPQGGEGREMAFVVEGAVTASLHGSGDRVVDVATAGPGEMVGEIALLDGGRHTMAVRAAETATLLMLGKADLAALLASHDPLAFRLRRRLAALLTARHREQLRPLVASLGGEPPGDAAPGAVELEPSGPPDSRYLRRMAAFHAFDPLALWGFLTSGGYVRCRAGQTLLAEGVPSEACYLTINGAVEKVLVRGNRRIRVGLAGPGKPFGYESLIDGRASPVTAVTRERSLLLVIERDAFDTLFTGEDAVSRVILDVIQADLVATLRQTLRPQARLAASV